ncbi:hypothetical protein MKW98_011765 [Papaver atlanticum]|uniref:Response regulatory domain-containing protein n=1 Tax=Papaver atlanticum TaxID=357466 RepID=A0AAD4SLN6_9MAGN|nr:hypothetical protein MKW98_011765 [Papaver atlanticum]
MPEMSGFQLLQCIMQEFAGIQNGASFYLTKPLNFSDIGKLWKHIFTRKMETKNMKQTEIRGQDSLQHQKQKISNIDGSSSKANVQEHRQGSLQLQKQKVSNIGESSYILMTKKHYSIQTNHSKDGNFQGFNAPTHQSWVAHNTFIENELSINPQNIGTISHCSPMACDYEFLFDSNFNISEYLVDNDTDDNDIIYLEQAG